MPDAPSLSSVVCADVSRWHSTDFGDVSALQLDTPVALGHTCVTDFCMELFVPADTFSKPVEGTDYTLDRDAGTITFLSTSAIAWGQVGGGQESWTLIAYFNAQICAPEPECRQITCCPPNLHEHTSSDASPSGHSSNTDCENILVNETPASGSYVNFPTYVALSTDVDDAVIYYTLDGTDPDEDSTPYTAPFQVEGPGIIIRAIGIVEGCPAGPIKSIQYLNSPFTFAFSYACDTPDKGGAWGVFAPDGNNDHHWILQFTLTASTTIKRLELYQLDNDGNWTTGQVWSTDNPIYPWPDEPTEEFECYPLLVFIATVQQWSAYQASLGAFGAATHTWDLYGDVEIAAGGLFRLDIILDDGTKLSQTITAVCTVTPPLCPPPAAPTLLGKCDGAMDVTFSGTVGRPFKIYRTANCGNGDPVEMASGTINVSPKTVEITGLVPDCGYGIWVSIDEAGCGYRDSNMAFSGVAPEPEVSISITPSTVQPGQNFTVSWDSNAIAISVCTACIAGQVSLDQGLGCKAGNTPGSQVTSQAVCGVYTYTITGCGPCGTAIASAQVNVECAAPCSPGTLPAKITLANPLTFLAGFITGAGCFIRRYAPAPAWNGELFNVVGQCLYGNLFTTVLGGETNAGPLYAAIRLECRQVGTTWRLTIHPEASGFFDPLWIGSKTTGASPVGTYTQTSGCCTGPATITVS